MSFNPLVTHELPAGLQHLQASRYYIVAPVGEIHSNTARDIISPPAAILYYDWLLTLPEEIDRYWRPKCTGPTILFFLNRYIPFIVFIPIMISYFSDIFRPEVLVLPQSGLSNISFKRLVTDARPTSFPLNLPQTLSAIILLLRTYAIYGQSHVILIVLCIAWWVEIGVGIWGASSLVPVLLPPGAKGCLPHAPDTSRFRLAAAYFSSVVYEALIYTLTLARTLRHCRYRSGSYFLKPQSSLISVIVRDGSIYFVVLLSANLLTILLVCLAEPDFRTLNVTFNHIYVSTTLNVSYRASLTLSRRIISRLLLNLRRDVRNERGKTTRASGLYAGDWQFTSSPKGEFMTVILGNIGEDFESLDLSDVDHSYKDDDHAGQDDVMVLERRDFQGTEL
ncbi:hypothetical protein BU17DRAFT_94856 [Hysterangium stoloniferum]|nr:hypothetical protein BU17DRAFT_94856 [Hysterangium stoloniferum]